ncbi:MAG: oxidative damage protection protein [Methylococcales bacterium]|nr:oxidative damage protection protein [Methylococcales bacterium]MBT7409844.1 oxidative damage protection protein [Methylococcales bacterium]
MSHTVKCVVLNKDLEGLDCPPIPGEFGERIYQNVSKEGWRKWLDFLTVIINENGLTTATLENIKLIERYMLGFLFSEGEYSQVKTNFSPFSL